MPQSEALEAAWLDLLFSNSNIANVGDATGLRGSSTVGSLYFALHTESPGDTGNATTNEAAYSNYARVAVSRSGGFSRTGSVVSTAATVDFPAAGVGANETEVYFSVTTASSGASTILWYGCLGAGPAPFTAKASTDTVTSYAHGLSAGDQVVFESIEGISLPAGITEGTLYFVIATGLTADAFEISTASGGSVLDITGDGGGLVYHASPIVVTNAITPRLSNVALTMG